MTLRRGKPLSLRPRPEEDGSHVMIAETPDGEKIELTLSEHDAVQFVRILQQGFVDRQAERQITPGFPQFQVTAVDIAHGKGDTALLVDTVENARMVFVAPPRLFEKMKVEIDRVLASKKARELKN